MVEPQAAPGTVDGGPAGGLTYSHSERRLPSTERAFMSHSLRYLANCSMLFTELPLLQRPEAARSAGFGAVEFWWPFEDPVPGDAAVNAFVSAVGDAGVRLVGLNFFAGDLAGPDCRSAVDPGTLASVPRQHRRDRGNRRASGRERVQRPLRCPRRTGCRSRSRTSSR